MASEVEQGALLHFGPGALGAHQAEGDIVLVMAAGTGTPDEHGGSVAARRTCVNGNIENMALHWPDTPPTYQKSISYVRTSAILRQIRALGGKLGLAFCAIFFLSIDKHRR